MQYAIMKVTTESGVDADLLIDANEVQTLEIFKDTFQELPMPSEECPLFVCYGSYMPQPGIGADDALGHLLEARGYWLGHVHRDRGHGIGFHDVLAYASVAYASEKQGKAINIPFAAAIQAEDEVIDRIGGTSTQAVTAFLRYSTQMDALTNVLNRPGIIALKGIERRVTGVITEENWQTFVDEERAKRTAMKIA